MGHNDKLVQNIFIKDSDDERSIRYFFMPDAPMEKGVPVELLTNYKSAYESVRERKGYGKNNVEHGLKSDSCRATCLQRNFAEREDVQNIINECSSVPRLSYLLRSIYKCTYCPLVEFLRKGQELTSLQWLALLRIHWIIKVFWQNVRCKRGILMERKMNWGKKEGKFIEMEEMLNEMEKTFAEEVLPFLPTSPCFTERRSDVYFELLEEICFPIRLKIPHILDTSIYSSVAVRFTESLCKSIAIVFILLKPEQRDEKELHNRIMEYVSQAKIDVDLKNRQCSTVQLTQIAAIIDVFASTYLNNCPYSMQNVCSALDLDYEQTKAATKFLQQFVDQPTVVKSNKPCARKDGKQARPTCIRAEIAYSGPPTIPFPGNGTQWPDGWTQKSYKRASGATKGRIDDYWFPPGGTPKLRSRVEVCAYLARQAK